MRKYGQRLSAHENEIRGWRKRSVGGGTCQASMRTGDLDPQRPPVTPALRRQTWGAVRASWLIIVKLARSGFT